MHKYITGVKKVDAAVSEVDDNMAALLDEVVSYNGEQVLRVAAYFHTAFESTYPFADGNGRVGRTLFNYYLMTHKCPPLIVFDEESVCTMSV